MFLRNSRDPKRSFFARFGLYKNGHFCKSSTTRAVIFAKITSLTHCTKLWPSVRYSSSFWCFLLPKQLILEGFEPFLIYFHQEIRLHGTKISNPSKIVQNFLFRPLDSIRCTPPLWYLHNGKKKSWKTRNRSKTASNIAKLL